jgi:hypothetical protein
MRASSCAICSNNVNKAMFYVCLSCRRSPSLHMCESCYLDDRKGVHSDCEFDVLFVKQTPSSWLATPAPVIVERPLEPQRFLLRCLVRATGTAEAVIDHGELKMFSIIELTTFAAFVIRLSLFILAYFGRCLQSHCSERVCV